MVCEHQIDATRYEEVDNAIVEEVGELVVWDMQLDNRVSDRMLRGSSIGCGAGIKVVAYVTAQVSWCLLFFGIRLDRGTAPQKCNGAA